MKDTLKNKPKILVIVGPTASGKTSLSVELGKIFNGEIISADSRQIYRGLNIGTGKITQAEMEGITHHLLDVADPQDTYTVTRYIQEGRDAITDIVKRGKLPIIVGGTFFYIDALLGKISTPDIPPNEILRNELEQQTLEMLFKTLQEKDPERAKTIDSKNKRRLIRALEIIAAAGSVPVPTEESLYDTLVLGIQISKEILEENIRVRLTMRIEAGMIDEVTKLHANGLSYERMQELGIEYAVISDYLQGKLKYCEMISEIEIKSRQYAKRQKTWLKRDKNIVWLEPKDSENIKKLIGEFLKS